MKHLTIVVTMLTLVATATLGLDDTVANRNTQADRYMKAVPLSEGMRDAVEQMAGNFPPEYRQTFKDLLTKYLDFEVLTKATKDAMVKHFTADELNALADFYGSAVGKSAMKKLGVYMAEVMPAIQAELMKAQMKANRDLRDNDTKK